MKLAVPTDFDILDALSDGRRNTAVNLSYVLDKNRSYINTRLPILADYGLVERVGPAPNSGLYEITEKGRVVVELRDKYRTEGVDFDALVEERLAERTE
ncbi:ArsR family transcriptional regulator [Halopelagius fulvigenes]|uniref:ArsR family transcriptional regulator n=1 Tax=Halopelagius fulvigenes TaxID=1198324 RepID=A0ABD5TXF2_9EURY